MKKTRFEVRSLLLSRPSLRRGREICRYLMGINDRNFKFLTDLALLAPRNSSYLAQFHPHYPLVRSSTSGKIEFMNSTSVRENAKVILARLQAEVVAHWPGYVERQGQKEMMDFVLETLLSAKENDAPLDGSHLGCCEGKTGTGKTLGYLLPAIAVAQATDQTVVIATATVALQEQLYLRDLPQLMKVISKPVDYQLLKGRGRYVCAAKLERGPGRRPVNEPVAPINISGLRAALGAGRWNGERDSLPEPVSDAQWNRVCADPHSCLRAECPQYASCKYLEARRRAAKATIVIANHDLVLSALTGTSSIFDLKRTLFVFDEAHRLMQNALEHYAYNFGLGQALSLGSQTEEELDRYSSLIPDGEETATEVFEAIQDLMPVLRQLQADLPEYGALVTRGRMRFEHGVLPGRLANVVAQAAGFTTAVCHGLTRIVSDIQEIVALAGVSEKQRLSLLLQDLGQMLERYTMMDSTWAMWLHSGKVPRAKWIEREGQGARADWKLCASEISAAKALTQHLWKPTRAVVLTSATMTACGNFDFFAKQVGFRHLPGVRYLSVASPFDYANQGEIVVPPMRSTPKEAEQHTRELGAMLSDSMRTFHHGQLALFASRRQMEQVYAMLAEELRAEVLMQGSMTMAQLLQIHQDRIRAGRRSVIFGLQSFGEGMDLPGQLCEHVLIAKIPFAPPDGAVDEALAEWLHTQNRDPFAEITVPRAAWKLAQWAGRGIRTEHDEARITIFDKRLTGKRYGQDILKSLPPLPVRSQGQIHLFH